MHHISFHHVSTRFTPLSQMDTEDFRVREKDDFCLGKKLSSHEILGSVTVFLVSSPPLAAAIQVVVRPEDGSNNPPQEAAEAGRRHVAKTGIS